MKVKTLQVLYKGLYVLTVVCLVASATLIATASAAAAEGEFQTSSTPLPTNAPSNTLTNTLTNITTDTSNKTPSATLTSNSLCSYFTFTILNTSEGGADIPEISWLVQPGGAFGTIEPLDVAAVLNFGPASPGTTYRLFAWIGDQGNTDTAELNEQVTVLENCGGTDQGDPEKTETQDQPAPTFNFDPLLIPDQLVIPALGLRVPVVLANYRIINLEGQTYQQWEAPNKLAVSWQVDGAGLGAPGNTLLFGHNNIQGKVFKDLYKLEEGQIIELRSGDEIFTYRVVLQLIVEEKYQPLEVRTQNARWLLPSTDERITLVTCWPANDDTHRLIVVAVRISDDCGQCSK